MNNTQASKFLPYIQTAFDEAIEQQIHIRKHEGRLADIYELYTNNLLADLHEANVRGAERIKKQLLDHYVKDHRNNIS